MKRKEIVGEISYPKGYLQKAERSRKDAQDTQRQYWRSPEDKAKARRIEKNRDKGMMGYAKRYNKEHPRPEVKPRDDMKTSSGPQDWYGQNRYMGDSVEEGAELKKAKREYNQAAKDAGGDWAGAGKKIDNMKKSLRQKDVGKDKTVAEEVGYDEITPKSASYILRKLDQGVSMVDILDDFPELGRMMDVISHDHGLHPDDDFEQIEDILQNDLEDIASEEDDFGDYDQEEVEETTGMLKVARDDENQTILQNPTTGVQTQIDKKNPNAPRLAQDEKGKLTLQMPQGAQSGGLGQDKPQTLVGKEVSVDQLPPMEDIKKLAGL